MNQDRQLISLASARAEEGAGERRCAKTLTLLISSPSPLPSPRVPRGEGICDRELGGARTPFAPSSGLNRVADVSQLHNPKTRRELRFAHDARREVTGKISPWFRMGPLDRSSGSGSALTSRQMERTYVRCYGFMVIGAHGVHALPFPKHVANGAHGVPALP